MKAGTKDALWATAVAVAVTGLLTWRDVSRGRRAPQWSTLPPEPVTRGAYR